MLKWSSGYLDFTFARRRRAIASPGPTAGSGVGSGKLAAAVEYSIKPRRSRRRLTDKSRERHARRVNDFDSDAVSVEKYHGRIVPVMQVYSERGEPRGVAAAAAVGVGGGRIILNTLLLYFQFILSPPVKNNNTQSRFTSLVFFKLMSCLKIKCFKIACSRPELIAKKYSVRLCHSLKFTESEVPICLSLVSKYCVFSRLGTS